MKITTLNTEQLDATQEVGNIAAAYAATSLSKLCGQTILIEVSDARIVPVDKIPSSLGEKESRVAAVYMDVNEGNNGSILLVFPYEMAIKLSSIFLKDSELNGELTEDGLAAISEISNICISSYLNAISKLLNLTFIPSPPTIAVDMLGAILETPASVIGETADHAIVVSTKFIYNNEAMVGFILFMPDLDLLEKILKKFGV
ncbi:MAG: chemotaxis protein CheC [Thermoplasmata archaeon]